MKKENEPFSPDKNIVAYIEKSVKDLKPDVPELIEWHSSYISNHKERIAFDLKLVMQNVPSKSHILEIGSIPLMLTAALAKSDFSVTGIDLAPERYSTSIEKLGIKVLKCDIEADRFPFNDKIYDAVVFFELFEHLRINPVATMKEVFRVLKPGGVLLLSTPNLKSVNGLKNYLLRNRVYSCCGDLFTEFSKIEKLGHMGHIREYTSTEITEFLENIGFKVEKLVFRGTYSNAVYKLSIKLFPSLRPFIAYIARKPE
ncbi:class I SAM-dependent methyltransferase [bacterium]|nr:class I SAM-dependent methyltransferase [bacterium]